MKQKVNNVGVRDTLNAAWKVSRVNELLTKLRVSKVSVTNALICKP